jgi:hypothetical protein
MYHQPDQLLAEWDPSGMSFPLGHPGTDVHIPDDQTGGALECKREDVSGVVTTLVLGIKPPHRVAAEKGDRHQSFPPLPAQNLLDHTTHQRAREWKSTAVYHDFTHSRPIEIPG